MYRGKKKAHGDIYALWTITDIATCRPAWVLRASDGPELHQRLGAPCGMNWGSLWAANGLEARVCLSEYTVSIHTHYCWFPPEYQDKNDL